MAQQMAQHIAWFDRHDPALEPVLGGKNTSLGIMTMAGLPVPPGFAVTAAAYSLALTTPASPRPSPGWWPSSTSPTARP